MDSRKRIREAIEAFDWEGYILEHYDQYQTTMGSNGKELRINCPAPDCGDRKFKCYINPSKQQFNCFRCDFQVGKKYNLFNLIAFTEDITPAVAMLKVMRAYTPTAATDEDFEALADETPENPVEESDTPRYITSLPEHCVPVVRMPFTSPAWAYCTSRGIHHAEALTMNLHFGTRWVEVKNAAGRIKGNVKNRLVIPLYHNRKLCGWQARAIVATDTPKYLNCPDAEMAKTLWPCVPPKPGVPVVIVEGVIDAVAVRNAGFNAYAAFSKKISAAQMRLLKSWKISNVTLWFDKKDALPEMISAVEDLKMRFDQVYVPSLKDWPKDQDTGDILKTRDFDTIKNALENTIDVYSPDFEEWKIQ